MKYVFQIFFCLLMSATLHAQAVVDNGPKAYFGYLGLDSIKLTDLLKFDTLKMNNPNLKILRFAIVSGCDINGSVNDLKMIEFEGKTISSNKKFFDALKVYRINCDLVFTVVDIEFINSKGLLVKYPRSFLFHIYE